MYHSIFLHIFTPFDTLQTSVFILRASNFIEKHSRKGVKRGYIFISQTVILNNIKY